MSERYEYCYLCEAPTGRSGRQDDSIYCDECGAGPLCEGCWSKHEHNPDAAEPKEGAMSEGRLHLLSGGIDSTVMLYDQRPAACLAFDYGQAHRKELEFAWWHCTKLAVQIELATIPKLRGSMLTDGAGGFVVPNRNAVMLNIAANMAASKGLAEVSFACTLDDADDFPDCTPYFLRAINESIAAAGCEVVVVAPYINLSKRSVVERGIDLGVNFYRTWSCYAGGDLPCGECKACSSRTKALRL